MPGAGKEGEQAEVKDSRAFIYGLKGSWVLVHSDWGGFPRVPLDFEGEGPKPSAVEIYYQQVGYFMRICSGDQSYSVPPLEWCVSDDISKSDGGLTGLVLQIGTYDFDKDGTDEIVVGWTLGDGELKISVIKYFPPQRLEDFGRAGNWKVFGPYTGQFEAILNGNAIELPYGSHGFLWAHRWVIDRFVEIEG